MDEEPTDEHPEGWAVRSKRAADVSSLNAAGRSSQSSRANAAAINLVRLELWRQPWRSWAVKGRAEPDMGWSGDGRFDCDGEAQGFELGNQAALLTGGLTRRVKQSRPSRIDDVGTWSDPASPGSVREARTNPPAKPYSAQTGQPRSSHIH
jgi:hypothetical protein